MYAGEYRRMYIECSIGLYVCRKDGTGSERKCNRFSAGAVGNGVGTAYCFSFWPDTIVRFRRFVFDREVGKEMILNGSSEFIGEMASAISMFAFNYVLMKYVGADGVAAFTILGFVVYGYSMVCIGFGQGISPIVSICWGAKEKETAIKIRSITNRYFAGNRNIDCT